MLKLSPEMAESTIIKLIQNGIAPDHTFTAKCSREMTVKAWYDEKLQKYAVQYCTLVHPPQYDYDDNVEDLGKWLMCDDVEDQILQEAQIYGFDDVEEDDDHNLDKPSHYRILKCRFFTDGNRITTVSDEDGEMKFDSFEEASKWISAEGHEVYALSNNEYTRPDFKIVPID